jgi:hypothetical protein
MELAGFPQAEKPQVVEGKPVLTSVVVQTLIGLEATQRLPLDPTEREAGGGCFPVPGLVSLAAWLRSNGPGVQG